MTTAQLGYLLALGLAGVFVTSAATKVTDLPATARGFRALGLPAAYSLARATVAGEVVVAVLLVAVPRAGGVAAAAVVAVFSAVVAEALRRGVDAPCACFGSRSRRPVSRWQLARNAVLALAALAVVAWAPMAAWT